MSIKDLTDKFEDDLGREGENRSNYIDDVRFAKMGEQWPEQMRKDREREGRPCLTINKMPAFMRQVINDSRMNKPQIKVKPVDDRSDPETAEILAGLIRNIEYSSQADNAYDMAIDCAVTGGMGFFRVCTEYTSEDEFTQDIKLKRIVNPLSVVFDSYSESIDGSDWNHCFMLDYITKEESKARFGKEDIGSFGNGIGDDKDTGDLIRIAEYWEVEKKPYKILMLSDGTVISEEEFKKPVEQLGIPFKDIMAEIGVKVIRERKATKQTVKQYTLGADELEKKDWAGKYLPIIPVFGDEVWIDGKRYLKSLIRDAKDPQQMFNFWRTATTELVALQPKAPWIGPVGAFETDAKRWNTANVKSHPYLEYDPVPEAGNVAPQRQGFTGPPAGALQEALNAADDMKAVMGIYDASLGARSNETSGKAIMARQREGDVSTFHFIDNLSKSIAHAGRVLVDLIPKIYDTPRVVRVLGLDGTTENVQLNAQTEYKGVQRVFDMNVGKYDVVSEVGPAFTTQRQEAAEQMTELIRSFPQAAPIIGDLLAKNLDWPDADEIQKRLKAMLPPNLRGGEEEGLPPEAMAVVNGLKQQIDQMKQAMQQGMGEYQKMRQELESMKADKSIDMKKLEIDEYNAETNRIKVQLQVGDVVTDKMLEVVKMGQPNEANRV